MCRAFRDAGHDAYSCDLVQTRGNPEWHYMLDVMDVIPMHRWGLIILHPDCTAMAVSGNRWYGKGMPLNWRRYIAIDWTLKLWDMAKEYADSVALENPNSVIFPHLRRAGADVQYVQPHDFGHGETKKTGFALHNLPRLVPTDKVDGREQRIWKMPPGPNRKRDRSETFLGIAKACVVQWG